jgi:exonuclease III
VLVVAYAPTPGFDKARKVVRRVAWDAYFVRKLESLYTEDPTKPTKHTKPIIICGDLNIIMTVRDFDGNYGAPRRTETLLVGAKLQRDLSDLGFYDTFRVLNGDARKFSAKPARTGHAGSRLRLDYVLAAGALGGAIKSSHVLDSDYFGSDHCPVAIVLSLEDITPLTEA